MTAINTMRQIVAKSGWWGLWSAFICGAISIVCVSFASMQPVLTVTEAPQIEVHEFTMGLIVSIDKRRDCPSQTQRWLVQKHLDEQGKEITVWRFVSAAPIPPVPLGNDRYLIELLIPDHLSPGRWFYRGLAQDDCSWLPGLFRSAKRVSPDVPGPVIAAEPIAIDRSSFPTGGPR